MKTYRFYKNDENLWHINLPNYLFLKEYVQIDVGVGKLLSKLADGKGEITLQISRYPIAYGDGWLCRELVLGIMNGAIYTAKGVEIDHKLLDIESKSHIWLRPSTLLWFLGYPKTLYYKIDKTNLDDILEQEVEFEVVNTLAFGG